MPTARIPTSRFAGCTNGVLDECVGAVAMGRELDKVVPGLPAHHVALVARDVLEVLEAEDSGHREPQGGDWRRSIVAEAHLQEAERLLDRGDRRGSLAARARAEDMLEDLLASSDRSPVLWYEDIFREVVQALVRRGDPRALVRQSECLAEQLSHPESPNLAHELRDLALIHVELGEPRRGLNLLASLLRHDPSDPWAYNVVALGLPRLGYPSLGRLAAERGLELIRRRGDRERLTEQLSDLAKEAGKSEQRSDAPEEAVETLRDALNTPFEAKGQESLRELALRLVPEVAMARVKQLPPMPTPQALADIGARLRPFLKAGFASPRSAPAPAETRPPRAMAHGGPKVGPNQPCSCGSGKKFKRCCAD